MDNSITDHAVQLPEGVTSTFSPEQSRLASDLNFLAFWKLLILRADAGNRESSDRFGVVDKAPLGLSLTFVTTPFELLTDRS